MFIHLSLFVGGFCLPPTPLKLAEKKKLRRKTHVFAREISSSFWRQESKFGVHFFRAEWFSNMFYVHPEMWGNDPI